MAQYQLAASVGWAAIGNVENNFSFVNSPTLNKRTFTV